MDLINYLIGTAKEFLINSEGSNVRFVAQVGVVESKGKSSNLCKRNQSLLEKFKQWQPKMINTNNKTKKG